MAPLGSPDGSQPRFGSGLCSTSTAPTPPASGFGFDNQPHLQRLLQGSAFTNEHSSFQIQQQARQFFWPQRPEHIVLHNGGALEAQRASSNTDTMVADLSKDTTQLGQPLQSYVQGGAGEDVIMPSLMRYHSAPSSMLASLTGMGNAIINPNSELGQFLSSTTASDSKDGLKPMDTSRDPLHIENSGTTAASLDRLASHGNGHVPPHIPYQRVCGGELISQIRMDADDVPVMRAHDGLSAVGKAALHSPSSYCQKSSFMHGNTYLENGDGSAHGMPIAKDGLLRHSSSPAGFLSQLNDEHDRHMLPSSSGNSSEEGSYERQGGGDFLGSYAWDDTGNMTMGPLNGSLAARKRIRDLGEKGFPGSTLDSQKADALERSVLGNYSGLPTASSPENAYFPDKLSPDSIPCRTRAKRGCATHPRSIAERVRRTKISERMKKLQELVPNMDKQANTAEMLDEAVEYVKYLQHQVQKLTENQSKCNCSCGGKPKEGSPSK